MRIRNWKKNSSLFLRHGLHSDFVRHLRPALCLPLPPEALSANLLQGLHHDHRVHLGLHHAGRDPALVRVGRLCPRDIGNDVS